MFLQVIIKMQGSNKFIIPDTKLIIMGVIQFNKYKKMSNLCTSFRLDTNDNEKYYSVQLKHSQICKK